ncbi:MAG: START domain-containing protein [Cyclobacteriaceae bacterium]
MRHLLFLFCLQIPSIGISQNWTLRKDQDSIRVYTAHTDDSKFKRIRTDFTIRAEREKLFDFLLKVDNYTTWQFNTVQSRLIEKISSREVIYYNEVSAPWPVSKRDLVIHLKIEENENSPDFKILTWSEPNILDVRNGIVRVPFSKGEWKVTENKKGVLIVRFEMQIDPGGAIPVWLVNLTSSVAPYYSFKNLKQMLEGPAAKR